MKEGSEEGLYIISIAARLAHVHPQTLRLYERKGLLCPERTPKNRRRYSDADIEKLKRIQELTQSEGLNLSGVRKVLRMEEEIDGLKEKLDQMKKEMGEIQSEMLREVNSLKRRFALTRKAPADLVVRTRRVSHH